MKRRALKDIQGCSFWSYVKRYKVFSKINDSVKSCLYKWIISTPRVILYTILNDYISVKSDNGNGWVNTVQGQKVLLRVSVCELHLDMLKNMIQGFPWHIMKNYMSVLVILLFGYFFCHNYKRCPSSIKSRVAAKYAYRL